MSFRFLRRTIPGSYVQLDQGRMQADFLVAQRENGERKCRNSGSKAYWIPIILQPCLWAAQSQDAQNLTELVFCVYFVFYISVFQNWCFVFTLHFCILVFPVYFVFYISVFRNYSQPESQDHSLLFLSFSKAKQTKRGGCSCLIGISSKWERMETFDN